MTVTVIAGLEMLNSYEIALFNTTKNIILYTNNLYRLTLYLAY
jgi:hypothetical protein